MPRSRSTNRELSKYPGLYIKPYGVYYVRHPVTKRHLSLETRDKQVAIRRWSVLNARWEMEKSEHNTDAWAEKVVALSEPKPKAKDAVPLLSDYLHYWRTELLGHHKNEDGSITWGETKIKTLRGKSKGKPVSGSTRRDLAVDARQLEREDNAKFPLDDPKLNQKIRKLLAGWLEKARRYNSLRNTLSRVLLTAVEEGVIDRNPMTDIRKAIEEDREVLVPDDAYLAITEQISVHTYYGKTMDGVWRAKVCDMVYMLSQQPIDVFGIKESQGEVYDKPVETDDGLSYGVVRFARHKTDVGVDLEMNEDLANLWRWFQAFKREQQIVSEYLMVYPRYLGMRSRAKPVLHDYIARAWAEAAKDVGLGGQYQLRDLRKKGLTEEFVSQGENDKGGHTTEAMRNHYRLIKPPKRARSTIKDLRSAKISGTDKA